MVGLHRLLDTMRNIINEMLKNWTSFTNYPSIQLTHAWVRLNAFGKWSINLDETLVS